MSTDPKLENYLATLDKCLSGLKVSDRADIITEMKSHALDSQERHPEKNMQSILAALGEPESVANRFLIERGLKPGKPARTPIVKWLTIGFLGTMALTFLFSLLVIWKFSPIISVNDSGVRILGGAITIEGAEFTNSEGASLKFNSSEIEGSQDIDPKSTKMVKVEFNSGKIDFGYSDDSEMSWSCKGQGASPVLSAAKDGLVVLDLSMLAMAKCDIELPNLPVEIKGLNGKIHVDEPQNALSVAINNGVITISPDDELQYGYELNVSNGKVIGDFKSSKGPKAIAIKARVFNGNIERQ